MDAQKFPYGDQFDPKKFSIKEILEKCKSNLPSRENLEKDILESYFSEHSKGVNEESRLDNLRKLSMNCFLSLRAYGLIRDAKNDGYELTEIAVTILSKNNEIDQSKEFSKHILLNIHGLSLLKAIENINQRDQQLNIELIAEELNSMGYRIATNSTYHSTMRSWLRLGGVFTDGYTINWDVVLDLIGYSNSLINDIFALDINQKCFMLSLLSLNSKEFTSSSEIAKHSRNIYNAKISTKNIVKDVLEILEEKNLIQSEKITQGRGAKPNKVKLSEIAVNKLLMPFLENVQNLTSLSEIELNRSFSDVVSDLNHPDKHVKGKALELLAIWLIRLIGIKFVKWRKRDYQTGMGEIDVLAASDQYIYSRWQIQCKNTSKVDVDVLAKEIGMTFVTKADVVMVVTTGKFSKDAITYSYKMMNESRYYMILIDENDIREIIKNPVSIVDILNRQARRAFAKRELLFSDFEIEQLLDDYQEQDQTIAL